MGRRARVVRESEGNDFLVVPQDVGMCIFITSWIHDPFDKAALKSILRAEGFDLDEYPDSPLKTKLKAPLYFRATNSQCDCGTDLNSRSREEPAEEPLETFVARLKAKGFGQVKITRLLEERERQKNKLIRERENKGKGREYTASAREWLHLLQDLLNNHGIRTFGIMLHGYSGNQILADFEIEERLKLKLSTLTEEDLRGFRADVAYEIIRG
jgi:hypothetical protein